MQFNYEDKYFLEFVNINMISYSEIFSEDISLYIRDESLILKSFSEMDIVYAILSQNTISSMEVAIREAEINSYIRKKEIENFLIVNKDLTVEDLKMNIDFRNTIVDTIGQRGYSLVVDDERKIVFHPIGELEGEFIDLDIVNQKMLDSLDEVINKSGKNILEYELSISDNEKKIGVLEGLKLKTLDNKTLVIVTTTVIDDYKVMEKMPDNNDVDFSEISKIFEDYNEIFVVSKDGSILAGSNENVIGLNIIEGNVGLSMIFSIKDPVDETIFIGPIYINSELVFVAIEPVYREDEHLGYFVVYINSEEFYERIENAPTEFDMFLVNSRGLLASPSGDASILVQEIKSDNSEECIDHLFTGMHHRGEAIFEFVNYEGDTVFGTHGIIDDLQVCLLSEYKSTDLEDKYLNAQRNFNILIAGFVAILLIIIFCIIVILTDISVIKEDSNKRNKILFYLEKMKLKKFILFQVLFLGMIYIVIHYVLGIFSVRNLSQYLDFMGLFFVSLIFKFSLKFRAKNKALILGGVILIFQKIVSIIFNSVEIYLKRDLPIEIWAIPIIVLVIGCLALLDGVWRIAK